MTLRFKQGEIAIFAVANTSSGSAHVDSDIEVTAVGPFIKGEIIRGKTRSAKAGANCDYLIVMSIDGEECMALDWQLRKKNPPKEPASLTHTNEEEITA